jgi:chromosome segregation ATPase
MVQGREKLNLCFLAALFHACTGMAPLHEELEVRNRSLTAQLSAALGDKEAVESEVAALRQKVAELSMALNDCRENLRETNDKLAAVTTEKSKLQLDLDELKSLHKQDTTQISKLELKERPFNCK